MVVCLLEHLGSVLQQFSKQLLEIGFESSFMLLCWFSKKNFFIFIFDNTFSVYFSLRDDAFFGVFFCSIVYGRILLSCYPIFNCMLVCKCGLSWEGAMLPFSLFLLFSSLFPRLSWTFRDKNRAIEFKSPFGSVFVFKKNQVLVKFKNFF